MRNEKAALIGEVVPWLSTRVSTLYRGWRVQVHSTAGRKVSECLFELGAHSGFPQWESFDFKMDLTAVLRRGEKVALALVQCETSPISLKEIGPLLACSRVASPILSLILSPAGLSRSLSLLLTAYNRVDILEYGQGKRIKIGTWDIARKQLDPASIIPPGELG